MKKAKKSVKQLRSNVINALACVSCWQQQSGWSRTKKSYNALLLTAPERSKNRCDTTDSTLQTSGCRCVCRERPLLPPRERRGPDGDSDHYWSLGRDVQQLCIVSAREEKRIFIKDQDSSNLRVAQNELFKLQFCTRRGLELMD